MEEVELLVEVWQEATAQFRTSPALVAVSTGDLSTTTVPGTSTDPHISTTTTGGTRHIICWPPERGIGTGETSEDWLEDSRANGLFRYRNGNSHNYESKDREKYSTKEREKYHYPSRNSGSTHLQDKTNYRTNSHYSRPVKDIYSVPQKPRERERATTSRASYNSSSVPHRIIYDTPSASPAIGSASEPFTKFRTRIVINSES